MNRHKSLALTFVVATLSAGCGDSTGPSQELLVSGTIQDNTQAPIPGDARVLVVWVVSSGPADYTYVFGEGSLDRDAGTFQVRLDLPPPAEARNAGVLGVGVIVVTTNQSVGEGDDIATLPETELIGAAGQYGVIYVTTPEQAAQNRYWAAEFQAGYGVGVGVEVPGDFDKFVPASPSSVVLTIDDWQNIEFVNWT
ncbi:MAG: hypothetical protein GTO46_14495 [Gemmatimonadetes bacterium]|nr:hypothetical protein [Gemmatimonadota bacterium]NIO32797.1 hypothetical protein [Gemmatimonadota bacterium]